MLRDPDHPSTTATPAGDSLQLSSTTPATATATAQEDCQPYDANQPAHQPTPVTLLAQSSDTLSPLPAKPHPSHPSHRRANTEIIPRQAPPSRKLFADQPKTFEDLDSSTDSSNPTAENTARRRLEEGAKRLSGWFQGKSEPVNLGVVYQTEEDAETMNTTMERRGSRDYYGSPSSPVMSSRAQKRMTAPSPLKQVTSSNPFSFFGLKRQGESRLELPEPAQDEFLNFDVNAALFPPGFSQLEGRDAFDALRSNADTMLRRLQAAYKQRTFALHEALAEKNEKQEELEVTRNRIGNLKVQLDGMAEKVIEQEKAVKAMAEELEHEREVRRREDEARMRSVLLVRTSDDESTSDLGVELQTPKRSMKRASNGTFTSDSGFDSGDESVSESVFSRREVLESPASTVAPSPNISQITLSTPTSAPVQPPKELKPTPAPAPVPKPKPTRAPASTPAPKQSTYDRVLKGLTPKSIASSWTGSKCNICHGVPSSEAWSVLGILKEENKGLKERLGELENTIDECLWLVGP
ncbi:hypothetical protein BO70DRAFT_398582 [Aspergillus heteromorphus CBS 117.55]|uniref:Uncharacterized protein n=1 Tax=Aspergillus heteromorphus CBS 117.55 TaxID=1448321 RepID=A0A317VLC7_9EURO|nr:uncharacterized protein BO70DRAFT_398582 [Aspergillus heteromorphus CBS 117.55]PWY75174.1 hypothetical protein BO70DRAFT_398582 [Aspergillus heteromorphus CBS 117.55]